MRRLLGILSLLLLMAAFLAATTSSTERPLPANQRIKALRAVGPNLQLSPTAAYPATKITVYGTGFWPNSTAWLFSPDFGDQLCCFTTSPEGSFTVIYQLPPNLSPRYYTIRGVDATQRIADARIQILGLTATIIFQTDPAIATLTFNGTNYSNGQSGNYSQASYTATANTLTGYRFRDWTATGGVGIANATDESTTVTISGRGTLKATFQASTTVPPKELLVAEFATLAVGILLRRRVGLRGEASVLHRRVV